MDLTFKTSEGRFNYRVAGIIIYEHKLLIMKDEQSSYYYLPGGRVQLHETSEDAILREMNEELQVEGKINRLLWIHENFFTEDVFNTPFHEICFYYLIDLPESFLKNCANHFVMRENDVLNLIFDWLPLTELQAASIYPTFLKQAVSNLPKTPQHIITQD